ncbi:sugar O-acetyltransferase [Actinomyces radicidentis]|uniref:sugar O-acetyltransferase n=1 Tax=Actinomyces radicidentis TaxID=111015 RepID=UPI0026DEAC36|nr:sugar O-acetyltransferase [Actinomyces radicidentis]
MSTTPDDASRPASAAEPRTVDFQFDDAETRRRLDSGELYVDFGPGLEDLDAQRTRGKVLAERFNATSAADADGRTAIARELFASFGSSWLETPIYLAYQGHTSIGDECWFNTGTTIIDDATVTIGDRVLLGPHVTLTTAGHPLDAAVRRTWAQYSAPITIGDDCWLGANVTVLPGVTIGDGSVIASGALVNRDVPPRSLVAGVPGRILREITEDERERDLRGFPGSGPMKRA